MAKPADKWAAARFWLADHQIVLGLPLAMLPLLVLFILFIIPFAPAHPVTRTVVRLGVEAVRRSGNGPVAVIREAGAEMTVSLPPDSGCRAGDQITLLRRRSLLGREFTVATPPCPTSWNGVTRPSRPAPRTSGG